MDTQRYRKRSRVNYEDEGETDEFSYGYQPPVNVYVPPRTGRSPYTRTNPKNTIPRPLRSYNRSMVPAASRGYQLNDVELKSFDTEKLLAGPQYFTNDTTNIVPIFIPVIGADINNRIGRKVTVKSLHVSGAIQTCTSNTSPLAAI